MKKSTLFAIALVLVNLVLEAQTPCPNTVINGDFEAGFSGFTSGLAYNCNCADATICVNGNFGQKCRGWSTLGNHTPGGTNYLIVDGSSGDPVNVWASTVPVSPGDTYTFSFWVATAYVSKDLIFDLGMIVNGQTVRQFTVNQATPTWTQYSVSGICPVGLRSMPIAIRQMTGGSFRDFGIDDIYFACCDCKADYTTTDLDGCGKIQFNNTSIVPGGIGYSWDFGDTASGMNNTSTEPNPIHQFSKCGTYNVCLTLKGEGCSSKICYTVDASDNAVPFIICPRNQTVNTNPGQCYFTGSLPQPSASDNCDQSPEIVCSLITSTSSILITPQTQFPKGENTIVCFARDKCGNVSRSCAYILTVRDNQAPKITCPISLSVTGTKNAQGRCQAVVRGLTPTTSDNCPMLTVTYAVTGTTTASGNNDASGITFLEGVSTVTYTVVDMDGNKATCSFTVTVRCPCEAGFNVAYLNNCGNVQFTNTSTSTSPVTYSWNFNDPTSGVNNTSTLQNPNHQFKKCGTYEVCLTITGGECSSKICHTVVVADREPPKITCPASLNLTVEACPVVINKLEPLSFSDNCGTPSVSFVVTGATTNFGVNDASGLTFNAGVSTITYTATDLCGNKTSCSFEVSIKCEARVPKSFCGQSAVTCFSGFNIPNNPGSGLKPNGNVLAMVDLRALTNTSANGFDASSTTPMNKDPQWVYSRMGQVFGLAIDANQNIYAAASTIYGKFFVGPNNVTFGSAGAGGIYKINPLTGAVTDFVKTDAVNTNTVGTNFIYNTGSGLGNICYDRGNNQFFATNFTDGKIYRISAAGIVLSTYDHPGSGTFPSTDATYVALGDRPYGIQINPTNGRLYYTVWREDLARSSGTVSNEVWSIALSAGNYSGAATCEVQIPPYLNLSTSCAPSDLAFSQSGKMLIGERTSSRDWPISIGSPAHQSRVLEYSGLPPFTGGCNAAVWGTAKVIYVGNFDVNNNCSGGVDYGYGGFDFVQNKPLKCDDLIWSTGDALKYGGNFNWYPGDYEVVYGLAGMPASGNTNTPTPDFVKTSSYYIDMGLPGKTEFGDVEIFKCGCGEAPITFPCDSISVTKSKLDSGACCFSVNFNVHAGPVAYVEAESLTPGVTFNNVNLSSSFAFAGLPTSTQISIKHNPFKGIPQGNYPNALQFCFGNITNAAQVPQIVVFHWYVYGPNDVPYLACTDTCKFECKPPVVGEPCAAIQMDSIVCDPLNPKEYCLYLKVKNVSTDLTFIASQLILSGASSGFSFKPCPPPTIGATASSIALPLLPPLSPGQSSGQLCVKVVALAPVISPTVVCFNFSLSGGNDCCNSSIPYCVTLKPCCNPCENREVVVRSPKGDSCCRVLDIRNDCRINYFTKLELQLLTPGVIFGSHFTGGPSPANWSNPVSTNTEIEWTHMSGYIPNGSIPGLINFCLDGIDQASEVPQKVVLNWIIPGANGKDSVACSDTLIFECKQTNFPCIKVLEDRIVCKKDPQGNTYYQYSLTFQNSASPPHVATELVFSQIGPPPVTVFPNPVTFPPLLPNGITTITTNIYGSGLNAGDKLTFEVRLHDALNPDNWCCFEADTVCIFIPECDSCKCGTFSDLSFRPAKGVMNLPVKCGDQLSIDCNTQFDPIISGSFSCIGADCAPPQAIVHWELRQLPSGIVVDSGNINATPAFSLSLLASYFATAGSYELTFSSNCNGKPCPPCKFIIKATGCPCCRSIETFNQNILNAVSLSVDNSKCKATLNIGKLPNCNRIEWVNWGLGTVQNGPFLAGDMPMFTYSGSGTYIISYLALEINPLTGLICFEKIVKDTIRLDCGGPCPNNLVPNPSFEQFTACPPGVAPPFTAAIWSLPSVGGSSDYYNSCAPAASYVSTPVNGFGNQAPRTGSGYAGFILRPTNLYREYLEVPLTAPLVAGNTYQVSFYVSLADQSKWAIDKFGAYLSVGSVGPITGAPVLPFVPQVMHPIGTFITDKTNWTQISGSYTATGGEDHLVIGNFYDNVATPPQLGQGGFYEGAYYYIDDVSVCATCVTPPCDSCCADSLTFAALVNQGFTVVNKGCSVTVTAPQFDSCYVFGTPPILDGANVPQVITDPSGSWTFNFTQSGVHQICVTVFDECQSKQMCTTIQVNCDTCECGFLEWATFLQLNGGFSSPIRCGGNNLPALPVPCPKPGQDYLIHGNYRCIPDACGTKTVNWVLDRPGTLSDVTGVSNATYPHFDVSIPWNLCTTPGTYVLHISRNCGGKECPCSFKFEVPTCPCSCDDLKADIAHGFNAVAKQAPGSCKRNFRPVSLCSNDIVSWSLNGVNLPGTTTGNNAKMITFSSSGIYTVCMTVIRTEPNGLRCEAKFCQKVKVKCNPGGIDPNVTFCANDVILNGDFTEGVEAESLHRGPRRPWTPVVPASGRSFVFGVDSSGSGDAGHLILNGGKGSFSGIWQQVNLSPNIFTTIEFDYKNYLGKSSPAGTVLEFRLEPDSISGGPSQILYRHMISDTSAAWTNVVVSVKTSPNPDFKYLVICLQNDDDALQSMVGIDNLSMCTRSISDTKNLSALKPIRIFPNPNPGSFNVELPEPATTGMTLRVTDLAGRLVLEKQTTSGNVLQTVQAENLSGGMYLLQLVEKGRVVGVEKFVKQ